MAVVLPLVTFELNDSGSGHATSGLTIQATGTLSFLRDYLLVAAIALDTSGRTVTSNDGWTALTLAEGTGRTIQLWYKIATDDSIGNGGTENDVPTWTISGASGPDWCVALGALKVDFNDDGETITLVDEGSQTTVSGTSHATPSKSFGANNRRGLVLTAFSLANTNNASEFNSNGVSGSNIVSELGVSNIRSAASASGVTLSLAFAVVDVGSGSYSHTKGSVDSDVGATAIALFVRDLVTEAGSSAFASNASLVVTATAPIRGDAVITSQAQLSPVGKAIINATAPLTSVGDLNPTAVKLFQGSATLTSTAVLAPAGLQLGQGASAFTSVGHLAADGLALIPGDGVFTSQASMVVLGRVAETEVVITSTGHLGTVTGLQVAPAAAPLTSVGHLGPAAGLQLAPTTAPLTSSAVLAPSGTQLASSTAPLTSQAVLGPASGLSLRVGTAVLTSQSQVSASAEVFVIGDSGFTSEAHMVGGSGFGTLRVLTSRARADADPLLEVL